jgi:glycogen debranching enzyme
MPVKYADALKPQSWAAGAPLLAIRTLLGLDVVDGELRSHPWLPEGIGRLRLLQIHCRGRRVDA